MISTKPKHIIILLLLIHLSGLVYADTFYISAVPDEDPDFVDRKFHRFAEYLFRELGVPVVYNSVNSYQGLVDGFAANRIQLGWFGGLTGVVAKK